MLMTAPTDRFVELGALKLHIRDWRAADADRVGLHFVLFHGLASNARTWDFVAERLAAAGQQVIAADQRGHGLSDKPDEGYDFGTLAVDIDALLARLGLENVILAGQSWGGNVLLEFAARYPGRAQKFVFVDGGFIDLSQRGSWEEVAEMLRPPNLVGMPREKLAERIQSAHPNWTNAQIAATIANFEIMPDGTVKPWLTLDRHMRILKAMYDQRVADLFPKVAEPVLICAADDGSEWARGKREFVRAAQAYLPHADVLWFENTAHDIHVDRPQELAASLLKLI